MLMKQNIPTAALSVMPNCGHAINIEDPDEFNRLVGDFIAQVRAGEGKQFLAAVGSSRRQKTTVR
jgi:hypothetical protein